MTKISTLSRSDVGVLLWIVGNRRGATEDEIMERESSRHRKAPTREEVLGTLARLKEEQLVEFRDGRYHGAERIQKAFLNEARNCRDTMEESDILRRIIGTE